MKKVAIILAGGRGSRMKSDLPKQFIDIKGKPMLYYSLDTFERSLIINNMLLVAPASDEEYIKEHVLPLGTFHKLIGICESGNTRCRSVSNALHYLSENGYDDDTCVYIHDSARPYVKEDSLIKLFTDFRKYKAALLAVPVKDTIKVVEDGMVSETPDRRTLWAAQTPQVFALGDIRNAYDKMYSELSDEGITDDAEVASLFGRMQCHITEGYYDNIKITVPEDLPNNGK